MPQKDKDSLRVFDVEKPGKTPPDASGRPVIVGHGSRVQDPMVSKPDEKESSVPAKTSRVGMTVHPPSSLKGSEEKVDGEDDQPIAPDLDGGESEHKTDETSPSLVPSKHEEPAPGKAAPIMPLSVANDQEDKIEEPEEAKANLEEKEEPAPEPKEEKPAAKPAEAEKPEDKPDEPIETPDNDSGDAAIGVVADQVVTKKDQEKQAQEEAAKAAEIEKMIASKQYYVPVAQGVSRKAKTGLLIFILILLLLAIGAVLAVDAGLIDIGIELPFDLIKN